MTETEHENSRRRCFLSLGHVTLRIYNARQPLLRTQGSVDLARGHGVECLRHDSERTRAPDSAELALRGLMQYGVVFLRDECQTMYALYSANFKVDVQRIFVDMPPYYTTRAVLGEVRGPAKLRCRPAHPGPAAPVRRPADATSAERNTRARRFQQIPLPRSTDDDAALIPLHCGSGVTKNNGTRSRLYELVLLTRSLLFLLS